jgi:hypothetical protein
MKIYNEVVIDMNPESSSYGETLHEDSYEYEGDMMLMFGWEDSGWNVTDANGDVWTSRLFINRFKKVGKQEILKNGVAVQTNEKNRKRAGAESAFNDYIATYGASGKTGVDESDYEGVDLAEGQVGDCSYTAGEFDPTSVYEKSPTCPSARSTPS